MQYRKDDVFSDRRSCFPGLDGLCFQWGRVLPDKRKNPSFSVFIHIPMWENIPLKYVRQALLLTHGHLTGASFKGTAYCPYRGA
jgi:hypothetical protein